MLNLSLVLYALRINVVTINFCERFIFIVSFFFDWYLFISDMHLYFDADEVLSMVICMPAKETHYQQRI